MHTDPAAYRMYRSIICRDVGTSRFTARLPVPARWQVRYRRDRETTSPGTVC